MFCTESVNVIKRLTSRTLKSFPESKSHHQGLSKALRRLNSTLRNQKGSVESLNQLEGPPKSFFEVTLKPETS